MSESRGQIRQFLIAEIHAMTAISTNELEGLPEGENLTDLGVVDSLMLVDIITAAETQFQFRLNLEHFAWKELQSLDGLAKAVETSLNKENL